MRLVSHLGAAAAAALLALPAVAHAGAKQWDVVGSGVASSIEQAAVVRAPDGNLHVIWGQAAASGSREEAWSMVVTPAGVLGAPTLIHSFEGMSNPNITLAAGGLLAIIPALEQGAYSNITAAAAPLVGAPWTMAQGDIAADGTPYYVNNAGVTTAGSTVFFSGAANVHRGLSESTPDFHFQDTIGGGCCSYDSDLATDGATGQVWLAWYSNATPNDGAYVHEVDTATGAPKGTPARVPGSQTLYSGTPSSSSPGGRTAITGRAAGQAGVYVAWAGGYPTKNRILVWRVGDPAQVNVYAGKQSVDAPSITADAAGRLWVVFKQRVGQRDVIVGRRSNASVTAWGAPVRVSIPKGRDVVWNVSAAASDAGVDVVANLDGAFYHRQLLPGLDLDASPSKLKRKQAKDVTFTASTEDGPAAGVVVEAAGETATTNASGKATIEIGPYKKKKRVVAVGTLAGYTPGKATVKVG
jgi:hypothetical protein